MHAACRVRFTPSRLTTATLLRVPRQGQKLEHAIDGPSCAGAPSFGATIFMHRQSVARAVRYGIVIEIPRLRSADVDGIARIAHEVRACRCGADKFSADRPLE